MFLMVYQEWGGKGLGRLKMKHEKGFGRFMVPKRGVGRVWEGFGKGLGRLKISMKRVLGVSHGSQEWGGKDGSFCCCRFRWSTKAIAAALDPTPS